MRLAIGTDKMEDVQRLQLKQMGPKEVRVYLVDEEGREIYNGCLGIFAVEETSNGQLLTFRRLGGCAAAGVKTNSDGRIAAPGGYTV